MNSLLWGVSAPFVVIPNEKSVSSKSSSTRAAALPRAVFVEEPDRIISFLQEIAAILTEDEILRIMKDEVVSLVMLIYSVLSLIPLDFFILLDY